MYATVQKSLGLVICFNVLEIHILCSSRLLLIDRKYSNIEKYYYNLK